MEKSKKILLADDIELFLELERNFLRRDDLDLLIAKDGRKALEMIKDQFSASVSYSLSKTAYSCDS